MSKSKEMDIEKMYQKKSQLEHILLRPDTYIGSVELLKEDMWVWDFNNERMVKKEIAFVPGLYKIFDEILVNASDNKQRDPNMTTIRVNINKEDNTIRVFNNGKGIPVVEHKEEKILVPTMIFGHLLTSSNYNDDEKKVTGGRNGYGAKLCNIFSKKFVLETSSKEYKKSFKQTWHNNMSKADEPVLRDAKDDDFTCITFTPDLAKFKMDCLDDDTISLLARRAYDIAASTPGIKVFLNDKKLPISKFEDYCKLYLTAEVDEFNNPLPVKLVYEKPHERWEIAVACSEMGFQQVSFVNSIATTKGGRHVDYVVDQLVKNISETINKKNKKSTQIKPFQIKNQMWLFVNCLIENPTFDSQTKENMTLQMKSFGSKCVLSDDFFKKLTKAGLIDRIMTWMAFKEKTDLEKAGSKSKQTKIKGIPKLDDANDAGTKESLNCTLIVTEGDSAKTLAVSGLGVIGRDKYGVFPLRGKMLNVREASSKQILENSEISSLLKIIGLNFKEKYESRESLKSLRYGKLMIMTDQDHDGSHIKGLLINFVHHTWPNLLKHGFVEEFITPIVKVSKGNQEKSFYSMPEFEEWQEATENWNSWKIKYYKGLGTSTSKEAKEYFSDMLRHRIKFEYSSARDDLAIQLAFSKKFIDERKDWLTRFMEDRKIRRETHAQDNYLYQKNTKQITYRDFINKELVLFSNLDNERSIPCIVDGFKPGQRKVLFTCFKRNLVKELKVAQLAGSVAELSAYHHGEASLMSTIINLAQNFVGSNNINLLQPIGQFGTRLHGGKDAASPRYIFTALSPLARLLFNPKDDPLFAYINDDGLKVEPEWYCPIIPTVLVNGSEGIGTGWSTKIPNYNPRELIENIRLMIRGEEPRLMKPFYKNFRGHIEQVDDIRVATSGEIAIINDNVIEITELPIGTWTQIYKEQVLETLLHGEEKKPTPMILDYKEYHTDTTVRFVVKFSPEQFREAEKTGLHKFFKLQKTLSLNSMVLFDHLGCLKRYESVNDILKEFFDVRIDLYRKRKEYLEGMMGAESLKLDNIARFIVEKIEGKIKVENLKKVDICKILRERNYNPDPVLRWKEKITLEKGYENDSANSAAAEEEAAAVNGEVPETKSTKDFDYLLGMPIWNLTMEKKDEILRQQRAKAEELGRLKAKTVKELWEDDLTEFLAELNKVEAKEKEDESITQLKTFKAANKEQSRKNIHTADKRMEYMPTVDGVKIEPVLDPSLLSKTETEARRKEKQNVKREDTKETNLVDLIVGSKQMSEAEIRDFMSKYDKKAAAKKSSPSKKEAEPKTKKQPKQEKLDFDENSNSNSNAVTISDSEDQEAVKSNKAVKKEPKKSPAKKTATKPAAKTEKNAITSYFKTKKKDSSDESEEESDADTGSISEVSFSADTPVEPRVISRQRKQVKYSQFLNSDTEESTKSSITTKSCVFLKENDDGSNIEELKAPPKKTKSATSSGEGLKKKKKKTISESDDEVVTLSDRGDSDKTLEEDDDDNDDFAAFSKKKSTAAKKTVEKEKEKPKPVEKEEKLGTLNAFLKMKGTSALASKPKRTMKSDDESDSENMPLSKKKAESISKLQTVVKEKPTTAPLKPSNSVASLFEAKSKTTATTMTKSVAKKKYVECEDDFIVGESDDDEYSPVSKKQTAASSGGGKRKLMDKPDEFDFPLGKKTTIVKKPPKNAIKEDDDLYCED